MCRSDVCQNKCYDASRNLNVQIRRTTTTGGTSKADDIICLFRQQEKLLKALENLDPESSYDIPQRVTTDSSKQPVSQKEYMSKKKRKWLIIISNSDEVLMNVVFGVAIAEEAVIGRGGTCVVCYN